MNRYTLAAACALLTCAPTFAQDNTPPAPDAGQQAMMEAWQKAATPGAAHRQLAEHFAGTWNTRQTIWMDPSAPPISETGRNVSTVEYGGRHVRSVFTSRFFGQPFEGAAITSYDNTKGKYVSHWIDSLSTGQFQAEGDYDAASRTYTFNGRMADPMNAGGMTAVREVIRIDGPDRHVMEMYESHDGNERKTMEIEYTRAK